MLVDVKFLIGYLGLPKHIYVNYFNENANFFYILTINIQDFSLNITSLVYWFLGKKPVALAQLVRCGTHDFL